MAIFSLLSLHVRGLSKVSKRRAIFTWCRRKVADIILLQETHSVSEQQHGWENEWGGRIYFSHGKPNARGVAILLKNGLDAKVISSRNDKDGRFLLVHIEIQDVMYKTANIYAPNKDNKAVRYFSNIHSMLSEDCLVEDNLI